MRGHLLFALAAMAPVLAHAEDPPPILAPDAIIVTAPGGSDTITLSNSTVNAQVLSGDALNRQHHSNLADLLDSALGSVTLSNGTGSPYQSDVSYRGFAATSLLGSPTGLSVWLDGVRMNEPFGAIVNWDLIPMNALASVEVLPGANPLFGLNTLGGALVLTTKNGAGNAGLSATVEGGSYNRRAVQAEAGGKLAQESLDWFVAGNFDDQDGYRWYTHTRVDQIYGKLRWHDAVSQIAVGVIWADTELNGTQGLPLEMLATPKMAYTWPDNVANNQVVVNLVGDTRLSDAVKLSGNLYLRRSRAHSRNSNASLGELCENGAYDCSALAPGGTAVDLDAHNPYPGGTNYAGALPLHDYTSGIETTLAVSDTMQHTLGGNVLLDYDSSANDLNLGASFETSHIAYAQNTGVATLVDDQTVPQPVNPLYGGGNPLINAVAIASHNTGINLFARDMIRLTRKVSLTASLSYTATHISLSGTSTTLLDQSGNAIFTGNDGATYVNPAYLGASIWDEASSTLDTVTAPPGASVGTQIDPVTGSHSYHRLNPALGLAWNPSRAISLFASYGEAMRAPTAIELACADPATPCALPTGFNGDPPLKAVVAHSLEAGLRGTIARHVSVNGAVYLTRVDNDIQFIYDPSGLGYFANLGRTERKGIEVGIAADWPHVHVAGNYGYVAATYRDSFSDANGDTVTPGSRITGIPAQSFKLRATWQPLRALLIGANLIAVSSQYAHGDEANRTPAVPGYAVVNLDVHLMPLPRIELFAKVTNLAGVHYATFGVLGTDIYTGQNTQFQTPAPGRAVLGGVTYGFGPQHASGS